jgi:tetratricopeptide (TPR) repeat protein
MSPLKKNSIVFTLFILLMPFAFSQADLGHEYLQGKALLESGEYDSALVYLDKALVLKASDTEVLFNRGMALYKKSQYAMAIKDFELVEKTSKGKASIWIARCYANLKDTDNCLKALEVHLTSNYRLPESSLMLDKDLTILENDKKYIDFWKNGNWYTGLDKALAEAGYLIKSKQYPEAIDILSDGLKKGYRKAPLYAKRAEVYIEVGNYKLALDDLNKSLELDQRNSELLAFRGNILYATGKYKAALEDYATAIKLSPDDIRIYVGKAMALNKAGFYDDAIRDMKVYLNYYPGYDSAWYHFGMIHFDNGNFFEALNCFNNSLKINQKDARYFAARGATYLKTRTYQYAWKDLAMALDLNPNDSQSYVNKGFAALNTGKKDDVCFCFEMAKKLGNKEAFDLVEQYCR